MAAGIGDDRFSVEPQTGLVSIRSPLDRETKDRYMLPVYVSTPPRRPGSPQFDVTIVAVRVTDVNDHAPEFKPGTCYTVAVPENSDLAVIHTLVATDLDSGPNGEVTYSITGEYRILNLSFIYFHRTVIWKQLQGGRKISAILLSVVGDS